MRRRKFIAGLGCVAAMALAFVGQVRAQDLMRYLDLTSPDMTSAEMTRAEVKTALASHETDFTGKNSQASTYQGSTCLVFSSERHGSTKPS